MENKKIVDLIYRILDILITDLRGDTVRIGEELEMSELLGAIENLSGSAPTLKSVFKSRFNTPEVYKEALEGILEDIGYDIEKEKIKSFFKRDWQLVDDLLKESDLKWIKGELIKVKNSMKKEENKVSDNPSLENTKELIRRLVKFLRDLEIGNSVNKRALFSDDFMKKVYNEVFGRELNLFDFFTEKDIVDEILWDYNGGKDLEELKDFLLDEKEIPENLLNNEVMNKLISLL